MPPPPQPQSGLSGIFSALNPPSQKPKPERPVPPPDTTPDAVASLISDLATAPTVNTAMGILQGELDQRLGSLKINFGSAPSTAFQNAFRDQIADSLEKRYGNRQQAEALANQLTGITFRKITDMRNVDERSQQLQVPVSVSKAGTFLSNPRGYVDAAYQKMVEGAEQARKDAKNLHTIAGGNGAYETLQMMMQTARSGVSFDTYQTVVTSYKSGTREQFRNDLDQTIAKTQDADEKKRLEALRDQLHSTGLSKDDTSLLGGLGKANAWFQYSRARTRDQTDTAKGIINFGLPLGFLLTGDLGSYQMGEFAGSGASGYGLMAGAAQAAGRNAFLGTYEYQVGGVNGAKYKANGVRDLTMGGLNAEIDAIDKKYKEAIRTGNNAAIRELQDELDYLQKLKVQYAPFLASGGDKIRVYDRKTAEIVDEAGNIVGHAYGKDFFYSVYVMHPKQWVDGLISGKQWARLLSLQHSRYKWMQNIGYGAERFMQGSIYKNIFEPWYRFNNKWIRGAGIKALEKVGAYMAKMVAQLQKLLMQMIEAVLKPLINLIARMLAKIGLNAVAAAFTAGGSLLITVAYEGLNFVTFGALDKVVVAGIKFLIDLSVLAVLVVFGVIVLCLGGISVFSTQALQGVGSQWVPVGGATLEFANRAENVKDVGDFVCPFGSGSLSCTQGPYGCFSHAQCSPSTGGGTCRSYEHAVDIGLGLGAPIVAPEKGSVTSAGDDSCPFDGSSSIGGYITFVGSKSGLTYKFFHVRGSVTGEVAAGTTIGTVSQPTGGKNACWTGPHSHSSVSGQNAENFYTQQPVNPCQFNCGSPNCTPTN